MKNIFLILLMIVTMNVFGQTFPTNRYYQVILKVDGVETKLSQHLTQLTAETKLNCREGYVIAPTGKTLTEPQFKCPEPVAVLPESMVDRITVDVHLYGGVFSPTGAVFDDCKEKFIVTKLPDQVIPEGTFRAVLQRTKNFKEAMTTYEVISMDSIPLPAFRVISNKVSNITSNTARIDIELTKKQTKIVAYLNGQIYWTFNPGYSAATPNGFAYYYEYKNLTPNTLYEVYTVNTSVDGETAESSSILFTTP